MTNNIRAYANPVTPDLSSEGMENRKKTPTRKRLAQIKAEYFPAWVPVIGISLFWLITLPGMLAVLVERLLPGALTGIGLVVATTLAVLSWETYTPKWRTMAIALALSLAITYTMVQIPETPGALLWIVVPTGLFVALRVNMNARRIIARIRNR